MNNQPPSAALERQIKTCSGTSKQTVAASEQWTRGRRGLVSTANPHAEGFLSAAILTNVFGWDYEVKQTNWDSSEGEEKKHSKYPSESRLRACAPRCACVCARSDTGPTLTEASRWRKGQIFEGRSKNIFTSDAVLPASHAHQHGTHFCQLAGRRFKRVFSTVEFLCVCAGLHPAPRPLSHRLGWLVVRTRTMAQSRGEPNDTICLSSAPWCVTWRDNPEQCFLRWQCNL